MSRKKILLTAVTVAGVGGIVALTFAFRTRTAEAPNPYQQTPREIAEFLAGDKFARLEEPKQRAYMSVVRESGKMRKLRGQELSDRQRETFRDNMRRVGMKMMQQRLSEYFALPPAERAAHMDQMIEGMERRRSRPRDREVDADEPDRPGRRERRRFTPERMKRMIERTDPETRARMAQFWKDLRERRRQRDLR
jgi:hypothetical protein